MRCVRWLAGIVGVAASFYVLGYAAIGMPTLGTAYWAARSQDRYCALRVPDGCDFLTQKFCGNSSTPPGNFHRKLARCMGSARKKSERVSCALVGSSSHLLTVAEGARIDAHDVVIRMNGAPDGFGKADRWLAKCVGRRTTVRFVNRYGLVPNGSAVPECVFVTDPVGSCRKPKCWNTSEDVKAKVECRPEQSERRKRRWMEHSLVVVDDLHPLLAQHFLTASKKLRHWFYRTIGFTAFTYAIATCDSVTVYGFGTSCDGLEGVRYYEALKPVQPRHPYNVELALMEEVAAEGSGSKAVKKGIAGWMRAANVAVYTPPCLQAPPVQAHDVCRPGGSRR
uniref:Sialyltransferase n=1 Tax=Alexandrium monilatum TaxID=311494 RepID=A0A7S4T8W9_9DINO